MDSAEGTKLVPAEEVRNEEDLGQGEPALGAIAVKGLGEKEFDGEGPAAADPDGLVDEDTNREDGGADGDQNSDEQLKEPMIPEAAEGESAQSVPRQVPRRRLRHRFTQWQLEELESIFQANCFLSVEARETTGQMDGCDRSHSEEMVSEEKRTIQAL
ncbi:Reproductive homeobox 3C [Apodemus speciosus]|uniref:Reproductive homeobox 3C n=1 Tax=Apodemus speciosus TaxID=105296 RepID=A0ABQ0FTY3_APOSI